MLDEELQYWLAICRFPKIGAVRLRRLYNFFPSLKDAFMAPVSELIQAGIEQGVAEEFDIKRKSINPMRELELAKKENLTVINFFDKRYPEYLKQIYNAPALLFCRGDITDLENNCLAVVGTRKISNYGKQILPAIIRELAKNKITIVSGMAFGIDALAHSSTIDISGTTIAVLGSSLDKANIYPASNRYLADKIIESGGLLISEYPIGTMPLKHHFPFRNRIISGLSLGTLIVEAGETSGALITAKYALDQNREIFAIPGPVNSESSAGTNNLIKQGAKLVSSADDILEELNIEKIEEFSVNKKVLPSSPVEKQIIKILTSEPRHIDQIVRQTGLSTSEINSNLTIMEMKGMVKNLGNQNFIKS